MKATGRKSSKGKCWALFLVVMVIVCFAAYSGIYGVTLGNYRIKPFGELISRGLDLQGGVTVVEEIVSDEPVDTKVLERTKELINLRVNKLGVGETVITVEGDNRIRVDIPGSYDSAGIIETLTKTGELTFKSPDGEVILTGKDVKNSQARVDDKNTPIIDLELTDEGTEKFAEATEKYYGQSISINMDADQISNPQVSAIIRDGKAIITGSSSIEEAKQTAGIIQSGALPVTLKTASVKTVGPTLGANAMPNAVKAGIVGVSLIFIFMILYYRVPGIIADLALAVYILLVMYTFSAVGVVLTLPGIAGLLLTIGMAVDANVLIFERVREELFTGKSIKTSIDSGFHRALSSILDSNITTIIAAVVLYFLGSGSVKGFALTLMIGIILSMFTAIIVTRFFTKLAVGMGILNKPSLFGTKKSKETKIFNIIGKTKIWFATSLILIVIGIGSLAVNGFNFGIDFRGGTQVVIDFGEDFDKAEVEKIANKYANDITANKVDGTQIEIKSNGLESSKIKEMFSELKEKYSLEDSALLSEDQIGASIGAELRNKATLALLVATVAMLLYVAIRFEFKFGVAAIIALIHDLLITVGIYAVFQIPVNSSFIAAVLTIVGYSINDTIVIFDRIRENSKTMRRVNSSEVADVSISQTMTRSINTVLTTLMTIVCVYIFIPSVREFALPLIIGIACGAYSSIFIASPVWVLLKNKTKKNRH